MPLENFETVVVEVLETDRLLGIVARRLQTPQLPPFFAQCLHPEQFLQAVQ
tara:strand:- start:651 stop:803 length:153 start_codon:yes stop_codon:yes gene_type:complete